MEADLKEWRREKIRTQIKFKKTKKRIKKRKVLDGRRLTGLRLLRGNSFLSDNLGCRRLVVGDLGCRRFISANGLVCGSPCRRAACRSSG
jgi:hypothetical protein